MTLGPPPGLVAGVDSSTQSCKVVVRDAETGRLVRHGKASHPEGTEVDPEHWWRALHEAILAAGGLDDVAAVSVAGQQHGMVCLDESGEVVRPALLWNDTRSAPAAADLVTERGAAEWAVRTGSVPVASFTVTKLRWLAEHEPEHLARTAAVCLPHDWLTWRLRGTTDLADLVTDRSDASGTGYFDARATAWCRDLLAVATGRDDLAVPQVLRPAESVEARAGFVVAAGAGDNAAALLGLEAGRDAVVSLGTSGVVTLSHDRQPADESGLVAGFADAEGAFLPLVCTLNAARVLDSTARLLGVSHDELSDLALAAPPGAGGLVLVPYLEGERTPNLPDATGAIHGLTIATATPAHLARAAVEGMLCGIAAGFDALAAQGIAIQRVHLVGGAAASTAVRTIAPTVLGVPVVVPPAGEYVADGAARQAAWALSGASDPPAWTSGSGASAIEGDPVPGLRERFSEASSRVLSR